MFHFYSSKNYFSHQLKQLQNHNPEYGHHIGQRRGWFGIKTEFFQSNAPTKLIKTTKELNQHHSRKLLCKDLSPDEEAASYFMLNRATGQITEEYVRALQVLAAKEQSMRSRTPGLIAPAPAPAPAETAVCSEMAVLNEKRVEPGPGTGASRANKRPKQAKSPQTPQETPKPSRTAQARTHADNSPSRSATSSGKAPVPSELSQFSTIHDEDGLVQFAFTDESESMVESLRNRDSESSSLF